MPEDFPTRFDKLGMFRLIADKIEREPALLQVGLDNIARWIANGAGHLRGFAPFAGILSKPEIVELLRPCAYAH